MSGHSAKDLYKSKIQNLESDYNQGSISKDDFLDDLEKYVMRLAKAKDKSRDVKTRLTAQLEAANEIIEKRDETILRLSDSNDNIMSVEACYQREIEGLKLRLRTVEEKKVSGEHVISDLRRKISSNRENTDEYVNSLKRKIRWLEVAIANVKQKFSNSEIQIVARDNNIHTLRQQNYQLIMGNNSCNNTIKILREQFSEIITEANSRDHLLSKTFVQIEKLQMVLSISQNNCEIFKHCVERGDVLLSQHESVIHQLLVDRHTLIQTIQTLAQHLF